MDDLMQLLEDCRSFLEIAEMPGAEKLLESREF